MRLNIRYCDRGILIQVELAVFYVESDIHVAMPYLQCIGAPSVSLSVSCKKGEFRYVHLRL
jgi:hypothetical protein